MESFQILKQLTPNRRFQFFPKKVFLSFFPRLISTARGIYK
ncbi:hypothetical protein LEP1GSC016_0086 [Leptospira borgpetersenii serovar Hardjo-bovis str. Sponselee]|uniref:Uncharacterized protein n=1 Tax=Leptospira borgpetersenii serovar Hardjo-bovis str. Sponselee TaxID=1303729 RepID=M6BFD1_LEPBO|nr:hypothetical protein LEP1GSC016_0086 [Leptospira borgpetersenii serovar Hardjo-bovis str. Sponselee]